jgi:SAM-dependent methyltransferase
MMPNQTEQPKSMRKRFWQFMRRLRRPAWLGTLRRTSPLSDSWGFDRGTPIDRFYIDRFVSAHRSDIRGAVLEVQDRTYTQRYGSGVERSEVLDVDPTNTQATIIADLAQADLIGSDQFDCFILTQTLQLIRDTHACIAHAHRILRPGGVLLVTVPFLSRMAPPNDDCSDYWRFTTDSCSALFSEVFGSDAIEVSSHGNILAAIAYMTGMAQEELKRRELEYYDQYFPVTITVRAVKSGAAGPSSARG